MLGLTAAPGEGSAGRGHFEASSAVQSGFAEGLSSAYSAPYTNAMSFQHAEFHSEFTLV